MGFFLELLAETLFALPFEWLLNRAPRPVALGCTVVFFTAFAVLMIWAFLL